MSAENAKRLLEQAERTNRERDQMDHRNGLAAPADGPPALTIRTAIEALNAGLSIEDWSCVAEATCMLGDLVDHHPWRRA